MSAFESSAPLQLPTVSQPQRVLRRFLRRPVAVVALSVIVAIYGIGILAPVIAPESFDDTDLRARNEAPSWDHPLGTDNLGHDLLSRSIWSAQTTVIISVGTVASAGLFLGVSLGLLAGYRRGLADFIIMRLGDVFSSVPTILLLIIINATLKDRFESWFGHVSEFTGIGWFSDSGVPSYFLVFGGLAVFGWVGIARLIRSQVLALRESQYVISARASGASTARILFRHLLPNVGNLLIVMLTMSLGSVAIAEIGLSYLGVGIQDRPTFGIMISEAVGPGKLQNVREHTHLILAPGFFVVALVLAFNLLGDQLTDILSPRRR